MDVEYSFCGNPEWLDFSGVKFTELLNCISGFLVTTQETEQLPERTVIKQDL